MLKRIIFINGWLLFFSAFMVVFPATFFFMWFAETFAPHLGALFSLSIYFAWPCLVYRYVARAQNNSGLHLDGKAKLILVVVVVFFGLLDVAFYLTSTKYDSLNSDDTILRVIKFVNSILFILLIFFYFRELRKMAKLISTKGSQHFENVILFLAWPYFGWLIQRRLRRFLEELDEASDDQQAES
jgi:hypothetical protein